MRFKEIISIQKIRDTETGKEYDGMVEDELLHIINGISYENNILKDVVNELDNLERSIPLVLIDYLDNDVVDEVMDKINEKKQLMI